MPRSIRPDKHVLDDLRGAAVLDVDVHLRVGLQELLERLESS
jgi:hypothetical protein